MKISDAPHPALAPSLGSADHILGSVGAPVQLVEYGDYECRYCGLAHLAVRDILKRAGSQICFAWRHFPFGKIHPRARLAALAAEAAGEKFWLMHDLLLRHQRSLQMEKLLEYARRIDLDVEGFRAKLEEERHAARLREQRTGGIRSGVNTTPTFYIQGRRHNGGFDAAALWEAILPHLEAAPRRRPCNDSGK